jgi:hypothetical protein
MIEVILPLRQVSLDRSALLVVGRRRVLHDNLPWFLGRGDSVRFTEY